jgi:DNA-binding transcriptional regulator YiaG
MMTGIAQEILGRVRTLEDWHTFGHTLYIEEQMRNARALSAYRKAAKISSRSVARLMGISAMYLNDLEHGKRLWSTEKAKDFLDAVDALLYPNI